jgi:16S rRNA (guanine(966)-N(2))-methyltransferase RsmD
VRESLFNVLAARLDFHDLAVLDLYAGSGALGLEALSRGAATVLLVEANQKAAAVIAQNISVLGMPGATVRKATVEAVLAAAAPAPVHLVFADPPYEVETVELERALQSLTENGWAATGTVAVVERSKSSPPMNWPRGWEPWRHRGYGDTRLEMAELGHAGQPC